MEANNIPNDAAINYPLTVIFINRIDAWCRHLPDGVRHVLIAQYQTFLDERDRVGLNMRRLVEQRRNDCIRNQRQTVTDYRHVAENWRNRNNNWTQLFGQRIGNNPPDPDALDVAVATFQDQLNPAGEGPQLAGVRIGHINLNSLLTGDGGRPDKFDNLRIVLGAWNFGIFVVGESKVKGVNDNLLAVDGYRMFRLDRDYPGAAQNDGGLLVYIRNDLNVNLIQSGNRPVDNSLLQFIEVEVIQPHPNPNIRVVAVYNPPWGDHIEAMSNLLTDYRDAGPNIIILGDINIDVRGNQNQAYQNYFRANPRRFRQCIVAPTRPDSGTLIDHIYTKQANLGSVLESGVVRVEGFADHHLIYCTVGNAPHVGVPAPRSVRPSVQNKTSFCTIS